MVLAALLAFVLGVGAFASGSPGLGLILFAVGVVLAVVWYQRIKGEVASERQTAPAMTVTVDRGRSSGDRSRSSAPPRLRPDQVAALPPQPPGWPVLPPLPSLGGPVSGYVAVADRVYARTDCPHCGVELEPLPKAKKRCPACSNEIFVKSGPDNRRYLMTAAERPVFEARWQQGQAAEWEARRVRAEAAEAQWLGQLAVLGITVGDMGLDVVGESFYWSNLVALTQRYPDGLAVALLQREPDNQYDRNAIKVLIDGVQVGHLSRDDAEDYQTLLKSYERRGMGLFLLAEITGGEIEDGMHGPVGVYFEHAPEPT